MKIDFYDKLVRDNIPKIIKQNGDIPIWHIISSKEEITRYLVKKVDEETKEFLSELSICELADLLEVLTALSHHLGYNAEKILEERRKKNTKNGLFNRMIVLDKVIRSDYMFLLDNKNKCTIFIPNETKNDEMFLVELLDACDCYLEPLKYGIEKNDIIEYLNNEPNWDSFMNFLLYKRYIVNEHCFLELAKKYGIKDECLKLSFDNVTYNDIEYFFQTYSLANIRNRDVLSVIQSDCIIKQEEININEFK